jgi:hypothetical protein
MLFEYKYRHVKAYKRSLNVIKYQKHFHQYVKIINNLNYMLKNRSYSNQVINNLSIISLYENGGYHSQGSYFHVVMMIQKGMVFNVKSRTDRHIYKHLLSASIIENLCFAYLHKEKMNKYLTRVKDGFERLNNFKIKNKYLNTLEKNVNTITNIDDVKIQIHIILKKLSILQIQ